MDFINGSAKHKGEFTEWGQRVKRQLIPFKAPMIISIPGRESHPGGAGGSCLDSQQDDCINHARTDPGAPAAPSAPHGPAGTNLLLLQHLKVALGILRGSRQSWERSGALISN